MSSWDTPGPPDDNNPNPGQQPPYGQPQYGQPQYGQPQYGQPQYGQPNPDQPGFGGYQGPPMPPPGYFGSPSQGSPEKMTRFGERASMGARFGGLVVDAILIGIVGGIVGAFTGAYSNGTNCDSNGNNCTNGFHFAANVPVELVSLAAGLIYSAILIGMQTQSLGHRVAGIRVLDINTGGPIGPGRGALRWLVMAVTGAICTLGYWSPFFDKQRRGWHDKASNSVAVRAR
ncbi:MAG: hypothetical protein JWM76_2635 [Pseudonocardiales bacterium]|nr:hypothetical protein [Pseudonocardiales bacterium]